MTDFSNNKTYLIMIVCAIIVSIIIWFVYRHFSKENFIKVKNIIIEKYNETMTSLFNDTDLTLNEIITYEEQYIKAYEENKKNYEISKTIYNSKLADLDSILIEIPDQNTLLDKKNSDLLDILKDLNTKVESNNKSTEILTFIKTDVLEKFKSVKEEIESRNTYYESIKENIKRIKDFITNFNLDIQNYRETLQFGEPLIKKIQEKTSEFQQTEEELIDFKENINENVKDESIKTPMIEEIDILLSKLNRVKDVITKQSDGALRELNSDTELKLYEKYIKDFEDLTTKNSDLLGRISEFLTNFKSKLETIDSTIALFENITEIDGNVVQLRSLIDDLGKI